MTEKMREKGRQRQLPAEDDGRDEGDRDTYRQKKTRKDEEDKEDGDT